MLGQRGNLVIRGLGHIGIAVRDLETATRLWVDVLGFEKTHLETVEDQGVVVQTMTAGDLVVELMEPTGPDTPVGKFLERSGPGLHHMALDVGDLDGVLERFRDAGLPLINEVPDGGKESSRVAFVHPKGCTGVLVELAEPGS